MSTTRKKEVRPELTDRQIAILASFVFRPHGLRQGRRGPDIARTAPRVFDTLFCNRRTNIRWITSVSVTMECKKLVRLGYMVNTGTVKASSVYARKGKDGLITYEYDSPTFVPTESGFAHVLAYADCNKLPQLWQRKRNWNWREKQFGYDYDDPKFIEMFADFARLKSRPYRNEGKREF